MRRTKAYKRSRKAVLGILRNKPRVRFAVRKAYWKLRKIQFDLISLRKAIQPKTVLFESYGGRSLSCSPKALFYEMASRAELSDWQIIWSLRESASEAIEWLRSLRDPRIKIVIRGTQDYFDSLATASMVITNTRLPEYIHLKPEQMYVQCWHGTPLKRLGFDAIGKADSALNTAAELAERFKMDSDKWTYLLSPSAFTSTHLFDAFGVPLAKRASLLLEEGYPRNDALIRCKDDLARLDGAREAIGIPKGKRVILYAPTWRDDSYSSGVGYIADEVMDFEILRGSLAEDWVVLFRAHYYIAEQLDLASFDGFVLDVSKVQDINDLYLVSDVLVTDYSSVLFDYALLERPMLLYVPDLDHYRNELHGFYMQLEEIPAPICTSTNQIVRHLQALDSWADAFRDCFSGFIERFAPYDDGYASKRVVDAVLNHGVSG